MRNIYSILSLLFAMTAAGTFAIPAQNIQKQIARSAYSFLVNQGKTPQTIPSRRIKNKNGNKKEFSKL